ncbi:hypothetical protein WJX82_000216 [Trebouxia sp. C0006]
MDPFDELTRVTTVATPNRQDFGAAPPVGAYQVGRLQLSPQPMQSAYTATAAGGNPFVDIHPPAAAPPTHTRPARATAFQDLLPTEFSGPGRSSNASPMNSAPTPALSSSYVSASSGFAPLTAGLQDWDAFGGSPNQTTAQASGPVAVDGLDQSQVDVLFQEADYNKDGRLAGSEAKEFFKRTSLADDTLFMIWEKTKVLSPAPGEGLTREQFSVALRLIAAAQAGSTVTPGLLEQAADPQRWLQTYGAPLTAPRLQPFDTTQIQPQHPQRALQHTQSVLKSLPRPKSAAKRYTDIPTHGSAYATSSHSYQPSQAGSSVNFDSFTTTSSAPALPVLANPFASGFGDMSLARPSAPILRVQKADMSPSGSPSGSPTKGDLRGQTGMPLAFDARLPPLHPKLSARLTLLAAAHGSLFAGPSYGGGLLQWARPEGNMRQPKGANTPDDDRVGRGSTAVLANAEDGSWTHGREDSDAAASIEVPIHDCKKPTCIHADEVAGILWTGHNDGRVCAFALDAKPGVALTGRMLNSWQAHRIGSVTVLITTPWGELWSGSSRGIIRVWRHAHKPQGETQRAVRELRRPGGGKPHGEVRSMTIPAGGQVVWTGGDKSTSLWCSYSGAFLGTIDRAKELGLPESSSFSRDSQPRSLADEWRAKVDTNKGLELDSNGKLVGRPRGAELQQIKEEQEGWGASSEKASHAFLENLAVTGAKAAGNAGKAAKYIGKLGFKLARNFGSDDPKPLSSGRTIEEDMSSGNEGKKAHHLRALVAGHDGSVWVVFKAGRIERFRFNAKLLWSKETGLGIASMAAVGPNIWVGLTDGRVRVYKDSGQQDFQAHDAGVIAIVPCGSRAFTLAADGSMKGWNALSPSPLDAAARETFETEAAALVSHKNLEMLCLTWNVNEQRPDGSPLFNWIADLSAKASVAVIALQEIEMGGGSVAVAVAKDILNKSAQEKGNNNAQWWQAQVMSTLGADRWMRVGLRQLSGMLVMVFALSSLSANVGEVSTASVACGVLGVGGNKGGVAVSFTLYRRRLCCVSSHFAAHQGAVEARNRDYANIVRSLNFVSKGWYDTQVLADEDAEIRRKEMTRLQDSESGMDSPRADSELDLATSDFSAPELLQGQGMRNAEMLVWAGDFNYRIDATYEDAIDHIRCNDLEYLLERDQCRREMYAGRVFRYVREAPITFRPTYKFDKHTVDPFGYDTSEKHRVPAWTDRIFFRGSAFIKSAAEDNASVRSADTEEPAMTPPEPPLPVDEVVVRAIKYSSCLDVIDSDHKPVWALLALDVPVTNQEKKRRMCSHILKHTAAQGQAPASPALQLSSDTVSLSQDERRPSTVTLTNTGSQKAIFCLLAQASRQWWGQPEGHDAGLPDWLEVYPLDGCIAPQESVTINLAAITNENVYSTQAMDALLYIRVGDELNAGAEQQMAHDMLSLHVSCRNRF